MQHGLQQIDRDDVGVPGHRHFRQLLGGSGDVQAAADVFGGLIEEGEPRAGSVLFGVVQGRQ